MSDKKQLKTPTLKDDQPTPEIRTYEVVGTIGVKVIEAESVEEAQKIYNEEVKKSQKSE